MAYFSKEKFIAFIDEKMDKNGLGYVIGSQLKDYVNKQPPADVEEVKHGYVIEHQGAEDEYYCECSVCKTHEICLGDKYCSECGARMDGGKTE